MQRGLLSFFMGGFLFGAILNSTNYGLNNYGFGSGGTAKSTSTNYSLNGISGETSAVANSSTTYQVKSGYNNTQQANVPAAPTLTNPSNYYDKLKFVLNPGTNPSDYEYAIAISTNNFSTTNFLRTDDTVGGSTISISYFQSYAAWGGSSGQLVTGLSSNTTYYIRVSALQGNFTNSEFGPTASATTSTPSITFSIHTDSQSTPPFTTSFGDLLPGTVVTASDKIWTSITTNADSGAYIYVKSANAGLKSAQTGVTISSASGDLSTASTGYGAQGVAVTQTSGGPLTIVSPYNVTGTSVGVLDTNTRAIFVTTAPITGGSGDFELMAKASSQTTEASDYQDTLTLTAASLF